MKNACYFTKNALLLLQVFKFLKNFSFWSKVHGFKGDFSGR